MPRHFQDKLIYRIIDANINRAKEGLRVCEEINRFILNNRALSAGFKTLRHDLNRVALKGFPVVNILVKERDSVKDIGRTLYASELKRRNIEDIFWASLSRVKESVRVLEEFSKLISVETAVKLKGIRYRLYELEKKAVKEIARLRNLK